MNTPANVPKVRHVQHIGMERDRITTAQLVKLRYLLDDEGVDPAELFGDGFTTLNDLDKWSAYWGINYLSAAQDARYAEAHRRRIAEAEELYVEDQMKAMIADYFRGRRG